MLLSIWFMVDGLAIGVNFDLVGDGGTLNFSTFVISLLVALSDFKDTLGSVGSTVNSVDWIFKRSFDGPCSTDSHIVITTYATAIVIVTVNICLTTKSPVENIFCLRCFTIATTTTTTVVTVAYTARARKNIVLTKFLPKNPPDNPLASSTIKIPIPSKNQKISI